jgi:hypothetical protein
VFVIGQKSSNWGSPRRQAASAETHRLLAMSEPFKPMLIPSQTWISGIVEFRAKSYEQFISAYYHSSNKSRSVREVDGGLFRRLLDFQTISRDRQCTPGVFIFQI